MMPLRTALTSIERADPTHAIGFTIFGAFLMFPLITWALAPMFGSTSYAISVFKFVACGAAFAILPAFGVACSALIPWYGRQQSKAPSVISAFLVGSSL